jgi:hypothetical protein
LFSAHAVAKFINFAGRVAFYVCWNLIFFLPLCRKLGGARSGGAEIIPLQPDAGNAAVGKIGKILHNPPFL